MKHSLKEQFLSPKKPLGRWLNSLALVLSSVMSFISFAYINFFICVADECSKLSITSIWVTFSPLIFMIGITTLAISIHLLKEKELESIYSDAICVLALVVGVIVCILPFSISNELATIT